LRIAPEPFDSPDAERLRAELKADIAERYGEPDTEPGVKPTAADIHVFLVARSDDGEPIGCGALRRLDAETIEIKRMYVRSRYRGSGVAPEILRALEEEAGRAGAARVVLETGTLQHEAIALYRRHGYERIPCFGAYATSPISLCFARSLRG
jgi:GNAT superfamily N-acetyltransferase